MMGLIIGGMIVGGLMGLGRAAKTEIDAREKKAELERTKERLASEYNVSKKILNNSADRAIDNLNANIQDTTNMRDRAAGSAGRQIVDQQVLNDMQIAQLEVQSAEAQGSALQDVAMSGTRRMTDSEGNVMNAGAFVTRRRAGDSIALARTQASIQTRQSLESANYSYTNANMQIRGYQRQIENTRGELADRLKQLQTSYDNQISEIDYDLGYMNSSEFRFLKGASQFLDFFGGAFGGLKSGINLYGTGKQYGLWGTSEE